MPDPWEPNYEKFKQEFEKYDVNEGTTLIGHSCGCTFLVRWLGDSKKKVRRLVLVAPWKITDEGNAAKKAFYDFEIDTSIKIRVEEIILFTSNNEADEGKQGLRIFNEALGGDVVELKNRGHYTLGDMGTEEFPELIEKIRGLAL